MFITDRHRSKGRDNLSVIADVLRGGCRWIQYREPDLNDADFYTECLKVRELCDDVGAGLIVNDRLDIASLVRADGIQLGVNNLPVEVVREHMGMDLLIGFSAHNVEEAISATWMGADFIIYSPLFMLSHKDSPHEPHGIEGAKDILGKIKVPVFFLGGVKFSDLEDLAGVIKPLRIATVSMISEAEDIKAAVEQALYILNPAFEQNI